MTCDHGVDRALCAMCHEDYWARLRAIVGGRSLSITAGAYDRQPLPHRFDTSGQHLSLLPDEFGWRHRSDGRLYCEHFVVIDSLGPARIGVALTMLSASPVAKKWYPSPIETDGVWSSDHHGAIGYSVDFHYLKVTVHLIDETGALNPTLEWTRHGADTGLVEWRQRVPASWHVYRLSGHKVTAWIPIGPELELRLLIVAAPRALNKRRGLNPFRRLIPRGLSTLADIRRWRSSSS